MGKILQFENGIYIYPRKGRRLFQGSGVPEGMKPGQGKAKIPMYITSVDVVDFDITGKTICLNDKRILYEFGKGFGQITIRGEVLLGHKSAGEKGAKLSKLVSWFNSNRVSKNSKPLTLSSGSFGGTFKYYLTTFNCGNWNPELGICNFTITGDLVSMTP